MSRTVRFLGGLGFGYVNQVLVVLVNLWLTPFLLKQVGEKEYGLWLIALQVLAYLLLMDFGVTALLPRQAAYASAGAGGVTKENLSISDVVGRTLQIVLLQTPIVGVVAIAVWVLLPAEWQVLKMPLGILLFVFVATFPTRIFPGILQGLQDLAFLGILQICGWILGTIVTVILALKGSKILALVTGYTASQTLIYLIAWVRVRRRFRFSLPERLPAWNWSKSKDLVVGSFWVSLSQVAQTLLKGTEIVIIGWILGPVAVVMYSLTSRLLNVLSNQPQMIMQAAAPGLSQLKMEDSRQKLFNVSSALTHAMLLFTGLIVCLVIALNEGFVNLWVGEKHYGGLLLTALLAGMTLLRHLNTSIVYSIFCFGHERHISLVTLMDGIVYVGACIFLVWWLGPIGAPIASIFAVCFVSLPRNMGVFARESGTTKKSVLSGLLPWFARILLLTLLSGIVAYLWIPASIFQLMAAMIAVCAGYLIVLLPAALRSGIGSYVKPYLGNLKAKLSGESAFPATEP